MNPFTYFAPATLDEAIDLLARHGDDAKLIAGGTALINFMKQQLVLAPHIIGLRRLTPLDGITVDGEAVTIGGLTTIHAIETSPIIAERAPLLAAACAHVATIRIRSVATIGGAVCHADPTLDTPPALIALDARIVAQSQRGTREVAANEFFRGIFETVLAPDEIVTHIVIPAQPRAGTAYLKFTPATHDDYPTVTAAVRLSVVHGIVRDARIALGGVGTTAVRAIAVERALCGATADEQTLRDAAVLTADAVAPMADFRGSADYKRSMAVVHVRRALMRAAAQAQNGAAAYGAIPTNEGNSCR